MPLVRFPVRNEYGLGQPELYKEANKEDPKAVLDGVAVAGLVGILRQLGDLAEFAAEVFHGLQEQVMATASRSHKLMVRLQCIEAALPPLEKAVLAQTSHIHFAYIAGSEWHPHISNMQNHFIYNDLPRFIMDSYGECCNPPHLHLLDKFDAGSPGSCLKRYSDPTFFKRVSGSSIGRTSEKIRRDKKSCKSKKKRSSQRNGEISRVASTSNQSHSGRMHSTSLTANGQISSQTVSKVEMTLKSDLHDRSSSFDSRTGSGYIECVFNLGSSLQRGEQGSIESSSRLMQDIDTLDPVFSDEPTQTVDNSFQHSSPPGGIASHSSCVTWDEKPEIVEPKIQQCDRSEASELLSANFGIDTPDRETANLRNVDQMDVLLDREAPEVLSANFDKDTPDKGTVIPRNVEQMDILLAEEDTSKSISSGNQLGEIENETDNYMDALNTIESESENDLDCQSKREAEQYSPSVNNGRIEDAIEEPMPHSSDPYPSNIESHTVSSISSGNGMSCHLPVLGPSESIVHEQTPHISGKSFDSDHSPGTDIFASADILDGSKVEPVVSDGPNIGSVISDPSSSTGSRFSDLHDQSSVRFINSFGKAQQSHAEFSSVQSVKFWTNGGLLGLEPSKPPDFAVSNTTGRDDVSRSKFCPPNTALKGDGQKERLDILAENAESSEMVSSSSVDKVPVPLAVADSKLVKSNDSHNSNRFNHGLGGGLKVTAVPTSGTELLPDVKTSSNEANQENDGNSSVLFGLGHRLLVNGFRRKLSLVHDEKSEPVSSLETGVFDLERGYNHDAYQTMAEMTFMEQFGHVSPLGSLTSSPPLEHMKISFKPANGFETSKLKLKFPDGSCCPESIRDMLPSFQLVPEPAIPSHDYGSNSDDDTFCRSSPYISDDCRSRHSGSNSDQWESSPGGSNEHDLYDELCQMSTMESMSSSLQVERAVKNGMHADHGLQSMHTVNDADPCLSLLDLPSFDSMKSVLQGETKTDSDFKNLSKLQNHTDPAPLPPLPPMQWRVSKSNSDVVEDKQYNESDSPRQVLDQKLLGSSMSQQPEPSPVDQQLTDKESVAFRRKSKQEGQQKLNGKKEVNHNANGKGMCEKEDFLHQIGTKSISLRPTAAASPTFSSGSPTNDKVIAILEKANAIRQAVASDDDEDDDSYSDT